MTAVCGTVIVISLSTSQGAGTEVGGGEQHDGRQAAAGRALQTDPEHGSCCRRQFQHLHDEDDFNDDDDDDDGDDFFCDEHDDTLTVMMMLCLLRLC